MRPAEGTSPLAAHKNSRKAQIHVGPLSNWNRQTAMLWEAIGPLPDSSEWHKRGLDPHSPFQRIGPARTIPPIPGKRLADARSNSSARDEVSKKEFCSSNPSLAWLLLQK